MNQTVSQNHVYLIRRNGIFHFTRRVSSDLQTRCNKETDFIPFQEMVDAVRDYCHRQVLGNPGERQVRKRLCELLGKPVQKRVGHHDARTRGFMGYIIIEDRDDDYSF